MKNARRITRAGAVWALLLVFQSSCVQAQSATTRWVPPRMPDGQPDISGYWIGARTNASNGAAYDIEDGAPEAEHEITGGKAQLRPHVVVEPADGKIPYQPWAMAVRDENRKNSLHPVKLEHLDSLSRCLQMGVPRMQFIGGFLTLQSPGFVTFLYSPGGGSGSSRTVALDGRPHIASRIKLWAGDSVGHWDGNTLIVDVTNINEHGWYDWAGNFHSNELHLTETWMAVDADTIDYEVTSQDPEVFTRPWKLKYQYVRNKSTNPEQMEDACYEGEKDVPVMLPSSKSEGPK